MSGKALFIRELFQSGPADIIISYMSKKPFDLGYEGDYEACFHLFDKKSAQKAFIGACAGGWMKIIEMLFDINFNFGKAMISASKFGQMEVVQYLLPRLRNMIDKTDVFENSFRKAIKGGFIEIAKLFLPIPSSIIKMLFPRIWRVIKNEEDILFLQSLAECDLDRQSYTACESGQLDVVQTMIENGTFFPKNCLPFACYSGNLQLVEEILKLDKEIWAGEISDSIGYACQCGHVEIVKKLISFVSDRSQVVSGAYYACKTGNAECLKILLENFKIQEILYQGYCSGTKEILQLVLEYKPDIDIPIGCYKQGFYCLGSHHNNIELTILFINYLRSKNKLQIISIKHSLLKICKIGNISMLDIIFELASELQFTLDFDSFFIEACRHGQLDCAKIMYPHVTKSIRDGIRAATNNGHFDVVNYFNRKRKAD